MKILYHIRDIHTYLDIDHSVTISPYHCSERSITAADIIKATHQPISWCKPPLVTYTEWLVSFLELSNSDNKSLHFPNSFGNPCFQIKFPTSSSRSAYGSFLCIVPEVMVRSSTGSVGTANGDERLSTSYRSWTLIFCRVERLFAWPAQEQVACEVTVCKFCLC